MKILLLVSMTAVVAGLTIWMVRPAARPAPVLPRSSLAVAACRFVPGMTAAYRVRSEVTAQGADGVERFEAVLSTRFEPRGGRGARVKAALSDVALEQTLTRLSGRVKHDLTKAFEFELSETCDIRGFAFPASWSPQARQLVASVLMPHAFVTGRGLGWTSTQSDGLGRFKAHYERITDEDAVVIERRKKSYLLPEEAWAFGVQVQVIWSAARGRYASGGGWLEHARGQEEVRLDLMDGGSIQLLQVFRLTRDDRLFRAPGLAQALDRQNPWSLPVVEDEGAVDLRLAGLTLQETLHVFREAFDGGSFAAARRLAEILRANPGRADELFQALLTGEVEADLHSALFHGLELAGTNETREVLTQALMTDELSSMNRARAGLALADHGAPRIDAVQALVKAVDESQDDLVASTSMLSLGILSGRAESESAVRKEVERELRARMDGSTHPDDRGLVLDAVGNTGDPALVEVLKEGLLDESSLVRAHSAEAFRAMPREFATPILENALQNEETPAVRAATVKTLRSLGAPSAEAVLMAGAMLESEPSPKVRAELIQWIGSAGTPTARAELATWFPREDRGPLLTLIGTYVPAEELR